MLSVASKRAMQGSILDLCIVCVDGCSLWMCVFVGRCFVLGESEDSVDGDLGEGLGWHVVRAYQ
jgi:hypothetical protein